MSEFKEFEEDFKKGFLLSNFTNSLDELEKMKIKKLKNSYFLKDKNLNLLYYFINEEENFYLDKTYITLFAKNEKMLSKHQNFLRKNSFVLCEHYRQMKLENKGQNYEAKDIEKCLKDEKKELISFMLEYFNKDYIFYYNEENLDENNALIYKKNGFIKAGLIFKKSLNQVHIDFIASSEKGLAKELMQGFFKLNKEAKFFKLFVKNDNERAIKFYEKFGFKFNDTVLNFYKNF